MKAVRFHAYGSAENLVYEEAPRPTAGAGEVLIQVKAAGINPLDFKVREGRMKTRFNFPLPFILGLDVAGVVAAVGEGVTELQVGQDIYGLAEMSRSGAYAEYAVALSDKVAPKPKNIDYLEAASVPVVAMTAWQALFDLGGLSAGQTVLIHAAAGGVGSFAVQLAKAKGARVIGTASTRNLDFVRSLGADEVIDYKTTKFEEVVSNIDVVLDTITGETRERSWEVMKPGGILISLISASPPSQETAAQYGVRAAGLIMKAEASLLKEIAAMLDRGEVKASVDKVFPLAEARQAHELIENGGTRGKIVLQVN